MAVDVHEAERIVLDYIREWVPNARQAPLAGNYRVGPRFPSAGTCRNSRTSCITA